MVDVYGGCLLFGIFFLLLWSTVDVFLCFGSVCQLILLSNKFKRWSYMVCYICCGVTCYALNFGAVGP